MACQRRSTSGRSSWPCSWQRWAATSIGANLTEATAAHSKADFIAKIGIARKEARETQYWLRLGRETGVLHATDWTALLDESEQVSRVIAAIARNAKRSPSRGE